MATLWMPICRFGPDQDGAGAGDDAQHLEGERRHHERRRRPCTMGTRRTTPSRSGLIENSPRPAAASSIGATLRRSAGKVTRCGFGSPPSVAKPVCTFEVVFASWETRRKPACPATTREPAIAWASSLIAARQLAQLRAGLVVEAAEALGRDVRRGPIRLGEDHVEGDGDAAERGQARDEIGHDRARPGPLADRLEARPRRCRRPRPAAAAIAAAGAPGRGRSS